MVSQSPLSQIEIHFSSVPLGWNSLDFKEPLSNTALPTIQRLMDKQRSWIVVWRLILDVSQATTLVYGSSSSTMLSFGTTQPSTLLYRWLHFKICIVGILLLSETMLNEQQITSVTTNLQQRQEVLKPLKETLQKMELNGDTGQQEANIFYHQCRWLCFFKLQPFRQQTLVHRVSQKLAKHFCGPFKVLRHIREVAYELYLPPPACIHPVVHIFVLHPYYGDNPGAHFTPFPSTWFLNMSKWSLMTCLYRLSI